MKEVNRASNYVFNVQSTCKNTINVTVPASQGRDIQIIYHNVTVKLSVMLMPFT